MITPLESHQEFDRAHRHFAVECNNAAWTLVEKDGRSPEEDAHMLDVAHASAFHWQAVGTDLNRARAYMLLAIVHAQLGLGRTALEYAGQMRSLFSQDPDIPVWEVAFLHAVHAHAAHAAGNEELWRTEYERAVRAEQTISDKIDREVFAATFRHVPVPPPTSADA